MTEETTTENGQAYTSAASYPGFKAPERHELPSGAVFLLRKPQIMKMMRKGQIPNPLMQIVNEVFDVRDELELAVEAEAKGTTVEVIREQREAEAEHDDAGAPPIPKQERDELKATDGFAFMDVMVYASIVAPVVEMEPPVGDTPLTLSGALSYDALADVDVQWILSWANGSLDKIATFPPDGERTDDRGDGREVRAAAE